MTCYTCQKKSSSIFFFIFKELQESFPFHLLSANLTAAGEAEKSWRILHWKRMLCPLLCDLKRLNSTSIDCFVCAGGCDTCFERAYWESKEVIFWKIFTTCELLGKCSLNAHQYYVFVFVLIGALCASRNLGHALFQNLVTFQKSLIS